jgi:hypothetical protein
MLKQYSFEIENFDQTNFGFTRLTWHLNFIFLSSNNVSELLLVKFEFKY